MPNITRDEYTALLARLHARKAALAGSAPLEGVDSEPALHDAILAECGRRGWYVIHSRMDRPTTIAAGAPDFVIFTQQNVLLVECKSRTGKVSMPQAGTIAWLAKLGHSVHIVRSMAEFNELTGGLE